MTSITAELNLCLRWRFPCRWLNLGTVLNVCGPPLLSGDQEGSLVQCCDPPWKPSPYKRRGKDRIIILWKASRNEWGWGGNAERGLFTDSGSTIKKKEEGWAGVLLRTCHISGGVRRGWREQAGQREERQAFIDTTAKTFSDNCWPLLRHFFFRMGLRKSWRGAWSASFQCRLCRDKEKGSITAAGARQSESRPSLWDIRRNIAVT